MEIMSPQKVYRYKIEKKSEKSDFHHKVDFFIKKINKELQKLEPIGDLEDLNFYIYLCEFYEQYHLYRFGEFKLEDTFIFFKEHIIPLLNESNWQVDSNETHLCRYRDKDCKVIKLKPIKGEKLSRFKIMDLG